MPYAPGAFGKYLGPLFCTFKFKQFSTERAWSSERRVIIVTKSNFIPRKEMVCTGKELALLPADLKSQLGLVLEDHVPVCKQ